MKRLSFGAPVSATVIVSIPAVVKDTVLAPPVVSVRFSTFVNATKGETALHRAAAFGSEATIARLLDAGAARDARDANGDTPLGWASWHTRPDTVLRLLCYGPHQVRADRDSTFDHGQGWGFMERDLLGRP
jgi:hypothetical protein